MEDNTIHNSILEGINKKLEPYGLLITTFNKERKDKNEHKLIDKKTLNYIGTVKLFHDIVWYNGCQYFDMGSLARRIENDNTKKRFSPKTYDPDWDDNLRTSIRIEEELNKCGFESDGYNKTASKGALVEEYATITGNTMYVGGKLDNPIAMYHDGDTDYVKCESIKQTVASLYVSEISKLVLKLHAMDDLERVADVKIIENENGEPESNVLDTTEKLLKKALVAIARYKNEPLPANEPSDEPEVKEEPKKKKSWWKRHKTE